MLSTLRLKRYCKRFILYAITIILTVVIVFPVYWLFNMSIKPNIEIYRIPPTWFPVPSFTNYQKAFTTRPLLKYIMNSIIITSLTTLLSVLVGSLAGYGFSRFRFKGSKLLLLGMLATRMIPPITLLFPLFLIMRNLRLLNSHLSLILAYTTFNIPFSVFLMYGFMTSIPKELDEAAIIDGCSRMKAFLLVILPMAKPGLISTAIMCILLAWKDFFWALRFTYNEASQTIPIGITTYVSDVGVNWGPMTAVGMLSILPILIFSLIVQKHMIKGLTAGAVKG